MPNFKQQEKVAEKEFSEKESLEITKQDIPKPLKSEGGKLIGGEERLAEELFEMSLCEATQIESQSKKMEALKELSERLHAQQKEIEEQREKIVGEKISESERLKEAYEQAQTREEKEKAIKALSDRVFEEGIIKDNKPDKELTIDFFIHSFEKGADPIKLELIFEQLQEIRQQLKNPDKQKCVDKWHTWKRIDDVILDVGLENADAPEEVKIAAQKLLEKRRNDFEQAMKDICVKSNMPIEEKRRIAKGKMIDENTEKVGINDYMRYLEDVSPEQQKEIIDFMTNQIEDPEQDDEVKRSLGVMLTFLAPLCARVHYKSKGELKLKDQILESLEKSGLSKTVREVDDFLKQLKRWKNIFDDDSRYDKLSEEERIAEHSRNLLLDGLQKLLRFLNKNQLQSEYTKEELENIVEQQGGIITITDLEGKETLAEIKIERKKS